MSSSEELWPQQGHQESASARGSHGGSSQKEATEGAGQKRALREGACTFPTDQSGNACQVGSLLSGINRQNCQCPVLPRLSPLLTH